MLGALLVYNVQYIAAGGTAYISCVQYLVAGGTAYISCVQYLAAGGTAYMYCVQYLVAVLVVLCIAKYVMLYWQTITFPCK